MFEWRNSVGMDRRITVLLVDDDPEVAALTAEYLERIDDEIRPVTAIGTAEGMETLASESVDCVVSDYEMPDDDGLSFLRQIREQNPKLPFILFTSRGSEEVASEAISAGITDYIQKARNRDQYAVLANRIRNAVDRASAEERAASLARINELIREVQDKLVRAETRDEIAGAVCDTLTNADPYALAWVGVPNEETDAIDPLAAGGEALPLIEELTVRHDDTPRGRGPSGRAVNTREPQVVDRAATDLTVESWRDLVEQYGIESLMVLPLVDDGKLHGILPLHADRPDAFDGEEQTVLLELADTIAAAFTAVETRRRLEQYETIASAAGDPMYVLDETGVIEFANESLATLAGYDRETVLGTHVSEYLTDEAVDRSESLIADLVSSTGPNSATIEVAVERADGTTIPCEDHISVLPFDEGFRGTAGVVRDISERKADERARQRLHEVATDPDRDFEATARKLLDIGRERLGLAEGRLVTVDEATGDHEVVAVAADSSHEETPLDLTEACYETLVGDEGVATHRLHDAEQADPDAAPVEGECYIGRSVVVDGEQYGVVGFLDPDPRPEFSDRERSFVELVAGTLGYERERSAARERIEGRETTLRRLHREVAVDRPVEDAIGAILELGKETLGLTHAVMSTVDGDRYEMVVTDSPHEAVQSGATFDVDETGCVLTIREEETKRVTDMSEAERWADLPIHTEVGMCCYIGTPLVVDDELYGTLCFQDTQPREKSFSAWEETLVELTGQLVARLLSERESQRMMARERDRLAEFASTLSHDLRTPLSVAIGYTEIARDRCTDEEAIESLTTASDALVRMERLIEDTLTLARDGQTVGETEPVALANVATEAWDGLDTGDATLTLADDLPHIDADPERLRRLLENLFRNSVEHGPPGSQSATGGSLTRGAASGQSEQSEGGGDDAALGRGARGTDGGSGGITVTVTATDDGFRVADDGTGISPEYHGTIFDWGHSANVDGTGLGLSIVDRIAEAHGWSARVTAAESGGAAFEFTGVTHA